MVVKHWQNLRPLNPNRLARKNNTYSSRAPFGWWMKLRTTYKIWEIGDLWDEMRDGVHDRKIMSRCNMADVREEWCVCAIILTCCRRMVWFLQYRVNNSSFRLHCVYIYIYIDLLKRCRKLTFDYALLIPIDVLFDMHDGLPHSSMPIRCALLRSNEAWHFKRFLPLIFEIVHNL